MAAGVRQAPLRIGVAGLGTVGAGLLRLLRDQAGMLEVRCGRELRVVGVSARSKSKDRGVDLSSFEWFDAPEALAASPHIDVFVELIGGEGGAAKASVEAALAAGKHVVTANKALIAHHGASLAAKAEGRGLALNFEAAVAGAIPIVKALRESLSGNTLTRVYGIMNGTTNYILSRMTHEGGDFSAILADAQAIGYAEADPAFDVGGHDAAHKLAILTTLAFGTQISLDSIYIEGIEAITAADIGAADDLGYRIKLLAAAVRTESGIEQRVHPAMVPKTAAIAQVDGVTNCVAVDADHAGGVMLAGPGAGAQATASSVVSDLADIARGLILPPFAVPVAQLKPYQRAQMREHEGGYYIRLSVYDRPGAFAAIATRMAAEGISLESIVQRRTRALGASPDGAGAPTPVIIITHRTMEAAIRRALDAIERDGHVDRPPQMIRIEKL
ncbi:MAG: homoserine dehydrogenase [Hyphomicrobiales bacterium]|nr:homoserine dehydrogenase [Hyphomicrobiales bacterium]